MARNPAHHTRTKHIDIKYHFVREVVQRKEITLMFCPTNKMIADVLTKGLAKEKFQELRTKIGMKHTK